MRVPNIETASANYTYTGGALAIYNGKLVPWDYSDVTNWRLNIKKTMDNKYFTELEHLAA